MDELENVNAFLDKCCDQLKTLSDDEHAAERLFYLELDKRILLLEDCLVVVRESIERMMAGLTGFDARDKNATHTSTLENERG